MSRASNEIYCFIEFVIIKLTGVYYNGRANCISYPLKGKHRIVHVKSRGEFIYYRDSETNQMIDGFILSNTLIQ